ncbi:MAG: hypothetical protein SVX43_23690 [Cyanobacteriota bacterium]|nr:hypothetical protein [Cyanobacteriota bacterium]
MGKKRKSSQFPKGKKPEKLDKSTVPFESPTPTAQPQRIQPEQMSLEAHAHIQTYLKDAEKSHLEQEDLNAVLRLSQHLRVFGLLSAVGYLNQSNDQEGKVRKRTVPIWESLLRQLLTPGSSATKDELMETVIAMTRNNPSEYMVNWRKCLMMSERWNFWARAYSQG